MLNIRFIFEKAIEYLDEYAEELLVAPLPAAVYLFQQDVLNHYKHAIEHYFPISLEEPRLQKSSLGSPFQKWAKFTNDDFLSLCIGHLSRCTSRLFHEAKRPHLIEVEEFAEMKDESNLHMDWVNISKKVGIRVEEEDVCIVTSFDSAPHPGVGYQMTKCSIKTLKDKEFLCKKMKQELDELHKLHLEFAKLSEDFYEIYSPIQAFTNMNECFWL